MEKYIMQLIIMTANLLEILVCIFLYASCLRRKSCFVPRLLAGLAVTVVCAFLLAVLRAELDPIYSRPLSSFFMYCIPLVILFIAYDEPVHSILLCWCAANATQEIGSTVFSLLLNFAGVDDAASMSLFGGENLVLDWTVFTAVHLAAYLACFFLFGRVSHMEKDRELSRSVALLSVISTLVLIFFTAFSSSYRSESRALYMVVQLLLMIFALLILCFRSSILTMRKHRQELAIMEEIIDKEKKQYDSIRENIDVINMKCHDLKHQLAKFQGKLTAQEIASLQEAITIYDRNIKTGNEALDVILCEKMLVCQKENILMTCLADGGALGFMTVSHIYSLISNAIDNAIEAVRRVGDPDKRVINISVRRENGVTVEVVNTFEGDIRILDGLPQTTKEDKNHHGYGVKSMRYIAEQYGGTLNAEADGDLFTLSVNFPNR